MRMASAFCTLGGIALALSMPAYAQHGGFTGRGGLAGHTRGVHFLSGARVHAAAPRSAGRVRVSGPPARFIGRPMGPVVILPPQRILPRPTVRVISPGFLARPAPFFTVRRFHRFHHGFGFPFCSPVFGIGISARHFGLLHREFACFPRPLFSPFFFPFAPLGVSTVVVVAPPIEYAPGSYSEGAALQNRTGGNSYAPSLADAAEPEASAATGPAPSVPPRAARPITLLQLKDGSMYGLADYWIEGERLHYITSYGGENSVPLERIDFDTTVQLNWERGVEFTLRPKPGIH